MSHKIISKFLKDVSFEIPNAQSFVMLEKEISNYSLNFDIKSIPYKNNIDCIQFDKSKIDYKMHSHQRDARYKLTTACWQWVRTQLKERAEPLLQV